jgi:hypothetical protein
MNEIKLNNSSSYVETKRIPYFSLKTGEIPQQQTKTFLKDTNKTFKKKTPKKLN